MLYSFSYDSCFPRTRSCDYQKRPTPKLHGFLLLLIKLLLLTHKLNSTTLKFLKDNKFFKCYTNQPERKICYVQSNFCRDNNPFRISLFDQVFRKGFQPELKETSHLHLSSCQLYHWVHT